jgi:hypothetical protein
MKIRTPRSAVAVAAAALSLCAFGLAATPAAAHDTWLEPRGNARGAEVELALTTGALFPGGETAVGPEFIVDRGCVSRSGQRRLLRVGEAGSTALALFTQAPPADPLRSCWVQTTSFDIEIEPRLIAAYLREIAAPESVRQAWAEQQRLGLPWRESYSKHARIGFGGAPEAVANAAVGAPVGASPAPASMAFDIEIEPTSTGDRIQAGQVIRFRALRDGVPLAHQAVELRGDASAVGLWRRTDAEGRASITVPLAGRWVLRATDLRPVAERPGHWESRFVTHTFTALAAQASPQPSKPSISNARSTNHSVASSAIATEPPTSNPRR